MPVGGLRFLIRERFKLRVLNLFVWALARFDRAHR
jgi:hypothetical protein